MVTKKQLKRLTYYRENLHEAMNYLGGNASIRELTVAITAWEILAEGNDSINPYDIAEQLNIPYSTACRLLRRFVDRGGITLEPDEADGRRTRYVISDQGKERLKILVTFVDNFPK